MSGKINFDNNDSDFEYQPTDSEDDYSEEEKELLKDIRKGNHRDIEPTRELLRFDESDEDSDENVDADDHKDGADDDDDDDDSEEDDDEMMVESDIEGADDDGDDIPDSKAWGKKARNYYNTDFVDPDYSAYNEKELELAQMEEEEARAIQQRLAQEMKETDFKFDLVTSTDEHDKSAQRSYDEDKNGHLIKLRTDLRGLSQREKMQLFLKDSPEFPGLKADLMSALNEINELLNPVLEYVQLHQLPHVPLFEFAHALRQLLSTYCLNINFYLILKVNRTPVKYHPVTRRLVELKRMCERLNDRYESVVKPQLQMLMKRIKAGERIEILLEEPAEKIALKKKDSNDSDEHPKKRKHVMFNLNNVDFESSDEEEKSILEDDEDFNEIAAAAEDDEETGEEGASDGDERRGITYQIAKNKGLTPYRKKELRNPRVKHRNKFRKALIRRKGAVRTVRKELNRYAGEMSGIKATVVKSIKFK